MAAECAAAGVDLVIAYHPVIFESLKKLTSEGSSSLIYDAARRGVAIYSPHTALDAAVDGTNDLLAEAVGIAAAVPLKMAAGKVTESKLVTFVPETEANAVAAAMFAAGGGTHRAVFIVQLSIERRGNVLRRIGKHSDRGVAGDMRVVDEVRLETIVPSHRVDAVVAALWRPIRTKNRRTICFNWLRSRRVGAWGESDR